MVSLRARRFQAAGAEFVSRDHLGSSSHLVKLSRVGDRFPRFLARLMRNRGRQAGGCGCGGPALSDLLGLCDPLWPDRLFDNRIGRKRNVDGGVLAGRFILSGREASDETLWR